MRRPAYSATPHEARGIGRSRPHHVAHHIVTSPHARTDAPPSCVVDPNRPGYDNASGALGTKVGVS